MQQGGRAHRCSRAGFSQVLCTTPSRPPQSPIPSNCHGAKLMSSSRSDFLSLKPELTLTRVFLCVGVFKYFQNHFTVLSLVRHPQK